MKKVLLMTIVCLLAFGITSHANEFELIVESKDATAGEAVTIDLNFSDNKGIIAALFELEYDRERLRLIKAEDKSLLEGAVFSQSYEKYPYIMLWNSSSPNNFTSNGTLVSLTFEVLEDAESGRAFVNITYNPENVYDCELNNVGLNIVNGFVNVLGKAAAQETKPYVSSGKHYGTSVSEAKEDTKKSDTSDENAVPKMLFHDVNKTDWYHDSVLYAFQNNLMNGTSPDYFSPDSYLTRGMLVTILYRAENEPEVLTDKLHTFADVDLDSYYAKAVSWAKQNSIVSGITENEFSPDSDITREQLATIIYRYIRFKGYDTSVSKGNISSYDDFGEISQYALIPFQYAVSSGLIRGNTDRTINPLGKATRAETATILQRFFQSVK